MVAWGIVADWKATVGTVGSILGLSNRLVQERRRRREDEADADRERANRESSQARLVSASLRVTEEPSGRARFLILAVNDSGAPIYDVTVTVLDHDNGQASAQWS